jgi:hypothetical protein
MTIVEILDGLAELGRMRMEREAAEREAAEREAKILARAYRQILSWPEPQVDPIAPNVEEASSTNKAENRPQTDGVCDGDRNIP